jgi:ABC-type multidrug transport system ATPase subunit
MLRDAPVLLLDEATTGLDTETAARVAGPIRALMAGRTTISITHDLTLAQQCDLILVLANGRLVQGGTHQELLGQAGTYRRLHRQKEEPPYSGWPAPHLAAADDGTSTPSPAIAAAARANGGTLGSTEWNNRPWWSTPWWREDP